MRWNFGDIPPDRQPDLRAAVRLEWLTIAYLLSCIVLIYLVMGSSQAMKSAWVEDLISLAPSVSFLVSAWLCARGPTERYPYGHYGVVSIAFMASAVALFIVGAYLLVDSASKLLRAEHPTVGTVEWFGEPIWLGWLMLPVLVWSVVPIIFIGRAKLPLARRLHDKTLYTDAMMNKADWLTAAAAFVGVLGIAVGVWWLDATAGCVISLDILRDGMRHVRAGVGDLMARAPRTVDDAQWEPLTARIETEWKKLPWVADAQVRLRESGHHFIGEGYIRPVDRRDAIGRAQEAARVAYALDWRLNDMVVQMLDPGDEAPSFGKTGRDMVEGDG